ncbi:hypothetical protein [Chengkuizengella marina]|uniref:Uncharacterized protein n=1 Tax=Chengkuizengella marina TaxID=2507566 RepID=A0A6N9Q690_9BACL|nr:hypothetical protein [Chengkuizengella marina]NBI30399.1 hypothetical protein [Chengkuizengella marina]
MNEEKVHAINMLIQMIDDLLKDLRISNPEYRVARDIAENPVIKTVSNALSMNGMYFALPTARGVQVI